LTKTKEEAQTPNISIAAIWAGRCKNQLQFAIQL